MTKKMIKPSRAGLLVRKADGSHLAADGEILPVMRTGCAVKKKAM